MDTTAQTDHDPALTGEGADQAQALVYPRINCQDVNVFYSGKQAVFDVSLPVFDRSVTALIGPSGCGKSTFLRCLNRMNDTIDGAKVTGDIFMDGENINSPDVDRNSTGSTWCSRSPTRFRNPFTITSLMGRAFMDS